MKKVFVNVSNHPSFKWEDVQKDFAKCECCETNGVCGILPDECLGFPLEIIDIPFPAVDPWMDDEEILQCAVAFYDEKIDNLGIGENVVVHIMGEMGFTFRLVALCKLNGKIPIHSTSERKTIDNPDGSKIVKFEFVRFRRY